jgi:hypothetical protein
MSHNPTNSELASEHPLAGAYARLDRAMEHLTDLKKLIGDFIDHEYEIAESTAQFDPPNQPPGVDVPVQITRPESPIPLKISILIGETVNNLRTGLDYLVYQLAILDSGSIQNGTQFPIEDTPTGFQGRRKSYLRGVSDSHAASIERLQPYNGVNWTRLLRTISNPDKHRHPIINTHSSNITSVAGKDPTEVYAPVGIKGLFIDMIVPAPDFNNMMHVQFHITFFIAFDDGLPVIETLEQMQAEVANTVANFKSEF